MPAADPAPAANPPLASVLEKIREQCHLPALAGAIFNSDGVVEVAVTGVRKAGVSEPATVNDTWHLGSDTKMMTAMVAGSLVAEGKLSWDAKVATFFPGAAATLQPAMQGITLGQLLSHQAGLVNNLTWANYSTKGNLTAQRQAAALDALAKPEFAPGAYHYSNADYVVAAAILEKVTGHSWEELIQERIFKPLQMASAGFGGVGTPGKVNQPWPHREDGTPAPQNGPAMDNPLVMAPSGGVHASMQDWAKFLIDQLRGARGQKALLPVAIYAVIQTPPSGSTYAYGWDHPAKNMQVLFHSGSNTLNFCVCWLFPEKNFGVLVCTNQGGSAAAQACDTASIALMKRYVPPAKP
jgi:CubicO group peptidase (beta-lactamase class C family)